MAQFQLFRPKTGRRKKVLPSAPAGRFGAGQFRPAGPTTGNAPTIQAPNTAKPKPAPPKLTSLQKSISAIRDKYGAFFEETAKSLGVPEDALAAVFHVEAGGTAFEAGKVIIRFENHIFFRLWGNVTKANHATFSKHFAPDPPTGAKNHKFRAKESEEFHTFHGNQTKEHEVLAFAAGLDETAGFSSASYGLGQIMGFNHKDAGFDSPKKMFEAFQKSELNQLKGFATFIRKNRGGKLIPALAKRDYVKFALLYNGKGQEQAYGGKIKAAADAYAKIDAATPTP